MNEKIKRLIYYLLLIVIIYLIFLVSPKLSNLLTIIIQIILPFLIAFVFTFILHPLVSKIQKLVKRRWIAVFIVMLLLIVSIFLLLKYVITILINEFEVLSNKLPDLIDQLETIINNIFNKTSILKEYTFSIDAFLQKYLNKNNDILENSSIASKIMNLILDLGKYVLIIPIIIIYMLMDYEVLISKFRDYLIKTNKIRFKNYLQELHQTMTSYFRGVLFIMLLLFMVFTIIFLIMDIENGMLFAFVIAITNIIPYIGSWIGTGLPVVYVLLTQPNKTLIVLIVCVVIQTIEADFLTPLIQGKQTKIHPLIIIISLLVFSNIFGFIGMLISVPMTAIIMITLKHYPIKLVKNKIEK